MSDAYEIDGVTLTPLGGGYYELKHSSIADPGVEKVQGKDKADARAAEIAKAAKPDEEASMEPQGTVVEPAAPAAPAEPSEADKARDDEIATLKAQLAESEKAREALVTAGEKLGKVVEEAKPEPAPTAAISGAVPRRYEGEMDAETKRLLKSMGLGVKRIILEENENIPPTGLFLGHNGRGYMIMPGGEVDVPEFLLNVLNDAVMAAPVVDPKTQKVLGYRNRLRYPYREIN